MGKLYRKCAICGCEYGDIMGEVRMELPEEVSLPRKYNVVTCKECGFAYADVNATQDDYNAYYCNNNNYSKDYLIHINKNPIQENRCSFLENYIDKTLRILDIGCGSGELLLYLKNRGYENVYGIDPSIESINDLRARGIMGWNRNIFDEIPVDSKHSFDVVCFTEVLEHIYNLDDFLNQVDCYLSCDGLAYVEVPAAEGIEEIKLPVAGVFNQEHINYFSLISLDNIFKKHGFIRINSEDSCISTMGNGVLTLNAIYKKTNANFTVEKDEISYKSIGNYFETIQLSGTEKDEMLLSFVKEERQDIIIWGTGSYAMQLLGKYPELKEKVAYFVDNNEMKIGKKICGKEIYSPLKIKEQNDLYPIIICAMVCADDIEKEIRDMQLKNSYIKM